MAETRAALDAATTDELIAALAARHREALAQATGGARDFATVFTTVWALDAALHRYVDIALQTASDRFLLQHPALEGAAGDEFADAIRRDLLAGRRPQTSPLAPGR